MSRAAPYPATVRARGFKFELEYERIRQSDTWALAGPEGRPWLLLMWMTAWEQTPAGSFPNDEDVIAAKLEMSADVWGRHRKVLMRNWWQADDGRLYHSTIARLVLEMNDRRKVDAIRKGRSRPAAPPGEGLRRQSAPVTHGNVTRDITVTPIGGQAESGTDHLPPITELKAAPPLRGSPAEAGSDPPEEVRTGERVGNDCDRSRPLGSEKKARRASRCPPTFVVNDAMKSWAVNEAPGIDVDAETAKFRDYEFKAGKSDWPAAWRNWMRTARDQQAEIGRRATRMTRVSSIPKSEFMEYADG